MRATSLSPGLAAILLAGCGADPAPSGPPPPRLLLVAERPPDPPREQRSLRVRAPRIDREGRVLDGELTLLPARGGLVARLSASTTGARVALTGPFPPGAVAEIDLLVRALQGGEFSCLLRAGGETVAESARLFVERGGSERHVVLPVPGAALWAAAVDEVVVALPDRAQLIEVELRAAPPNGGLPTPGEGPEFVRVGAEFQPAVGLSTERPVSCAVPAGARELAFCVALPERLRLPAALPVLRVERDAADDVRIPLGGGGGWQDVRVPLPGGGGRVKIALEARERPEVEQWCALGVPRVRHESPEARTVVLVTSDTHRGDHMAGVPHAAAVETPALRALAARGVLFEDCFSSTNITNPSHVALHTGIHARDTGVHNNHSPIGPEARTLAEHFAEAGYACLAAVSASHLGHSRSGLGQGFDRMGVPQDKDRPAPAAIEDLLGWLGEYEGEDVFLWLHVFDAHTPYEPAEEWLARHWDAGRDPADPSRPLLIDGERPGPDFLQGITDPEYPRALYRAEVDQLDAALARFLEHPRLEGAAIALTSDHGENLGAHGILYNHGGIYTDTLHVPLLLSWPGARVGSRCAVPVRQIDAGRTLLNLAGLADVPFPGRDLRDSLEPSEPPAPRFAAEATGNRHSVTAEGWHLIWEHRDADHRHGPADRVELFDLRGDPGCLVELAAREPARAAAMKALLQRWLADARPAPWSLGRVVDQDALADLAALGYAGDDE